MIKSILSTLVLTISCLFIAKSYGQKIAEPFAFQFEHKTLRGLIERPQNHESKAIVILIPGYGKTDFVAGNWFGTLRNHLVASGLTVCVWDKAGCGKSEGEFNAQQPVENSADEAIAAIQEIKKLHIAGAEKIGLWGISRAGWICPLINQKWPIDFWISVSGTDDKENYGYLLKSNLLIAGKAEPEAERLFQAWKKGHRLFCTNARYENYLKAIQPLRQDSTCRRLFGYTKEETITEKGREAYQADQKLYTSKGHFDKKSGLWVYIEQFDQKLLKINCPVLALFGANDSQIDWRKTKMLYETTMGSRPDAKLSIKVFEQCNHSLQKCVTCRYQEDLSAFNWQACEGYYEAMEGWLREWKIIE